MKRADLGDSIARDLTIRYLAVLAVLGLLALMAFLGLARIIGDAEGSAEKINLAGRQRMLVERAAFAANRLSGSSAEEAPALRDLLGETLDVLEARHGEIGVGMPAFADEVYNGGWHLDRDMRAFLAHGRDLVARPEAIDGDDPDLVALSQAASGPLLDALDEFTARFQRDSEDRMRQLLVLQAVTLASALVVLLASAFGVFHPMVERLKADMAGLDKAARDLRAGEDRMIRILEESPMGVSVSRRADGRIVFANRRFTDILGVTREEFLGSNARDHYVDANQHRTVLAALRQNGSIDDAEVEFRRRNGSPFWSLLTIRSTDFAQEPVNLAWIYDITERKAAEQQIMLAAKVLETVTEAVVITNADNRIIFVNPAFTAITEYSRDEVLGCDPSFLSSGRHDAEFYGGLWRSLQDSGRWSGEIWNRRKSGEFYAEWLSINAMRDGNGQISHYVAVFTDITHRKEDEERVWRQANYDALTGLPNRSLFLDRLSQTIRQSHRDRKSFALMFLDLDGFKAVNDSLGHAAGDQLLQQTAQRLSECMRGSDTLARLAGDEFVVILQGIRGREEPAIVAAKILGQLGVPYQLDCGAAQVQGSIGISVFPEDAEDGPSMIKQADEAMYAVKRSGKNGFRFAGEEV